MNICFFGVGGVGGYFGSLITEKYATQHNIYFVARGNHKDAIRSNGLTLKKNGGDEIIKVIPKICTDNTDDLPVCDIIILSVKSYDLPDAIDAIKKITAKETIILPLLNGVDIYERIREHLQDGIVLRSCVYVGTHIEKPGVIFQKGGNCRISIGSDPRLPEFYPEVLLSLLKNAHVNFDWENDVRTPIWSKFMFIAAYGLVTAAYNKTLGEILNDQNLSLNVKMMMFEIEKIARALSINLSTDIVEKSYHKANDFPFEAKTSFQRDVESKGKINERDLFGGTIIRYGKKLGIETPVASKIYQMLAQ